MWLSLPSGVAAYPAILASAILLGSVAFLLSVSRVTLAPTRVVALFALSLGALSGAKLYSLIERGVSPELTLSELFNGYRQPGGMIGCMIALFCCRLYVPGFSAGQLGDLLAPAIGVGQAVARVGCLLNGCCSGTPSSVPWAWSYPRGTRVWNEHIAAGFLSPDAASSLSIHPLPLYFATVTFILGMLAWRLYPHKRFDGQVILTYMALQGLSVFMLESLRARSQPHLWVAAMTLGIVCAGLLGIGLLRAKGLPEKGDGGG